MKQILALSCCLLIALPAVAQKNSQLNNAQAISDTDIINTSQKIGGNWTTGGASALQFKAYMLGSGTLTLNTTGTATYALNVPWSGVSGAPTLVNAVNAQTGSVTLATTATGTLNSVTAGSGTITFNLGTAAYALTTPWNGLIGAPTFATVATSGSYNDLGNKPSIPAAQVNSDWNAVSGVAQILNKPTLAAVATSGSYNDLSNKPSIPAAQVNSDWNAVSGVAQILNKPTIPTNDNQLTNGAGYITSTGTATSITGTITAGQVSGLSSTATTGTATALTGTITSSQVSGLGTAATANLTSLLQAANNLGDVADPNISATSLGLPYLLGISSHNYVGIGDSITQGAGGSPVGGYQSFMANLQVRGLGRGGATMYDLGLRQETTAQILSQYSGTSEVHPTLTTTGASATATVSSATGVSVGMCIGSANVPPNTVILAVSSNTLTLSNNAAATASGVACSIATAPTNVFYGELYCGGAANGWQAFNGTAHQLSTAISGISTDKFLLVGANDNYASATVPLNLVTTSGTNTVTVSSGTFSGLAYGNAVICSGPFSTSTPPYIQAGAGTATLTLYTPAGVPALASSTGTFSATVYQPITALSSWESSVSSLVSNCHADSDTVALATLIPSGNNRGSSLAADTTLYAVANAWIKSNAAAADHICDLASCLPTPTTGNPLYISDLLHPNAQGCSVEAKYIDTFYLKMAQYTQASSDSPFGVNQLPDSWHSTNVPLLNDYSRQSFTPASSLYMAAHPPGGVTLTITGGTASGTFTGTNRTGIQIGDYVYCYYSAGSLFPPGTYVTAYSASTGSATFSQNANASKSNIVVYMSSYQNQCGVSVDGNVIVGSNAALSQPASGYSIIFEGSTGSLGGGIAWQNAAGVFQNQISLDGSGNLYITPAAANWQDEFFNSAMGGCWLNSVVTVGTKNNFANDPYFEVSRNNGSQDIRLIQSSTGWKLQEFDGSGTITLIQGTQGSGTITANTLTVQTGTLTGGSATKTVTSGCHAWAVDTTAANPISVSVSGTTATVTGTGSDVFTLFNSGSQ